MRYPSSKQGIAHELEKEQWVLLQKNEYLIKDLDKLPKDFMELTLFELDNNEGFFVFSRIISYQDGNQTMKGAVYCSLV